MATSSSLAYSGIRFMDRVGVVLQPASQTVSAPRKAPIDREDILTAALSLVGPHRSLSTLSLREVARAAGIAPNSFYRHFHDTDELAVALIDRAGESLRQLIREARLRATTSPSIIRSSVEAFMEQLESDEQHLQILLAEGTVGSDAYKASVDRALGFFEDELHEDLIRLSTAAKAPLYRPDLLAKAITRLVFAMGGNALDKTEAERAVIAEEMMVMVRFLMEGAEALYKLKDGATVSPSMADGL